MNSVLLNKRGNAMTEYILLSSIMLVVLATIKVGAQKQCIKTMGGELTGCNSVTELIQLEFQKSIEDITLLINLPF